MCTWLTVDRVCLGMIEQICGSLELGGRRLLRIPYKGIRSKHALHSAFWCHGAGEIDLPSWWLFFLELPSPRNVLPQRRPEGEACTSLHPQFQRGGMLEFLYPTKTLASMRGLASTRLVQSKNQGQKFSRPHTLRSYSSDTTDASSNTGVDVDQPIPSGEQKAGNEFDLQNSTSAKPSSDTLQVKFRPRVKLTVLDIFENAFQKYEHTLTLKGPSDPELDTLFQTASIIGDKLISKRALLIKERSRSIVSIKRRQGNYEHAIQAALDRKDLPEALSLNNKAIKSKSSFMGSSSLLSYALKQGEWETALTVWSMYCRKKPLSLDDSSIWKDIDAWKLPSLMGQAFKLADFTLEFSKKFGKRKTTKSRTFAGQVILRALQRQYEFFDLYRQAELFHRLSKFMTLEAGHFNKAITQLLSVGQRYYSEAAVKLYGVMRHDLTLIPPRSILESLMVKVYDMNGEVDGPDIMTIFDDYKLHYKVPKARAFRLAIAAMAHQGDSSTVYSLLEEYRIHHPASINADTFWDLLYLHFQRAEVEQADRLFQEFPATYGVRPKVRCWNIMIAVHSRVSDTAGALQYYNQLLESGTQPNHVTFATIMSMHGARGEVEVIEDLLVECERRGIAKTCAMIDPLVLAHIKNDDVDMAERLVKEISDIPLTGVRTRMWNYLLNALAIRQDLAEVNRTLQIMRDNKVPMDAFTYAAIIHSLCRVRQPYAAEQILNVIMDHQNIKPSPLHYALVMSGLIDLKDYEGAIRVFTTMLARKKSDFNTQQVAIRAAARIDMVELSDLGQEAQSYTLERAEKLLDEVLGSMDAQELATHTPIVGFGFQHLDEAYTSGYFAYLINAYGNRKAFDKVAELYNKYITTTMTFHPNIEVSPPVNVLVVLMASQMYAREYEEVERCWHLAMEKSEQLAHRSDVNDMSQPGWVLPSRRHILSRPLRYYTETLALTDRANEIQPLLDRLLYFGYDPDNRCWNELVQILCSRNREVQAFEMCERFLMPSFPGWATISFMRAHKKLMPADYQLGAKMPFYKTFAYLAAAYLNLRDQQAFKSVGDTTMEDLTENYPQTLRAIKAMPLVKGELNPVRVRNDILEGRA